MTATPCEASPSAPLAHRTYDVFNGDADGICALHQLRLAYPLEAHLITGVKRDIELLRRVPCVAGSAVTVLDISLDTNLEALQRLLDADMHVTYFDHHSARHAFAHPALRFLWDDAPDVCTSLLVDRELQGRFRRWAIVAAFGDNLQARARALASESGLAGRELDTLEELGQLLNYNAYGDTVADLHVAPEVLYRALHEYAEPLDFIAAAPHFRLIAEGYRDDTARIESLAPHCVWDQGAIYILPDAGWARRISGMFANQLAARCGSASFAVLTTNADGSYVASVRSGAPQARAANGLCEQFPSGGGRRTAAGINRLPPAELESFISTFSSYFFG